MSHPLELEHFSNCYRPKMNCHSERSEESPHFARCATVYTFSKNAIAKTWLVSRRLRCVHVVAPDLPPIEEESIGPDTKNGRHGLLLLDHPAMAGGDELSKVRNVFRVYRRRLPPAACRGWRPVRRWCSISRPAAAIRLAQCLECAGVNPRRSRPTLFSP